MIAVLDRTAALGIAAELGEVFAAAFAGEEHSDATHFANEQLPIHADRDDFRPSWRPSGSVGTSRSSSWR